MTRLISNPVLILQSETPHVVSYGFWHGVRPNGPTGNEPGARPSPGAATLPIKPSSNHPRRIAVRPLLRPGTAALRLLFAVAADVSPLHPNTARKIMSRFTSAATSARPKAPGDWRSPRRFAPFGHHRPTRQRLGLRRPSAAFCWCFGVAKFAIGSLKSPSGGHKYTQGNLKITQGGVKYPQGRVTNHH